MLAVAALLFLLPVQSRSPFRAEMHVKTPQIPISQVKEIFSVTQKKVDETVKDTWGPKSNFYKTLPSASNNFHYNNNGVGQTVNSIVASASIASNAMTMPPMSTSQSSSAMSNMWTSNVQKFSSDFSGSDSSDSSSSFFDSSSSSFFDSSQPSQPSQASQFSQASQSQPQSSSFSAETWTLAPDYSTAGSEIGYGYAVQPVVTTAAPKTASYGWEDAYIGNTAAYIASQNAANAYQGAYQASDQTFQVSP